ncbi:MAG: hypothetical protein IJO61_04820 [Oscillospiraceae bacterium]|nr:hypothetical protein [Oscillospiraceae bacterium]
MKKSLTFLAVFTMMFVFYACGDSVEIQKEEDMPSAEEQSETDDKVVVKKELSEVEIGGIIEFGKYEQDNDDTNGKEAIRWRILEENDGEMLVVSEKGLDAKSYNEEYVPVTWETCTLRTWLNEEFYNEAFSDDEKQMIKKVTLTNDDGGLYTRVDGGNDTEDKVFLLSLSEVEKYFGSNEDRICETTDYAMKNSTHYSTEGILPCVWWLRTPGDAGRLVAMVSIDGNLDRYGGTVCRPQYTTYLAPGDIVRPAMWIKK